MASNENATRVERNAVFQEMKDNFPENKVCVDCGRANPQWASVNLSCFFCIDCSGRHRSLGVQISFVRSCTMDTWTKRQLTAMQAGGNHGLKQFLKEQNFPSDLLLELKYSSRAFELYRERIKALTEGRTPAPIPKLGFTEEDKTRWSEPKAAEPKASGGGSNMRAMGSEPQGGSGGGVKVDDVLASLSGGFWSAAGATTNLASNAASMVAKKSTEAASLVSKKSTEAASSLATSTSKLTQTDLTSSLKSSAATGWSGLSSWIGQAAQSTMSFTTEAANSLTEAVVGGDEAPKLYQRQDVGGQPTRKFEGFGGEMDEAPTSQPTKAQDPKASSFSSSSSSSFSSSSFSSSSSAKSAGAPPKVAGKKDDSWALDDYQPELNGEKFDGTRRENRRPEPTRLEGLRRTGSNPTETARGGFAGFGGEEEEEEEEGAVKFHTSAPPQDVPKSQPSRAVNPKPTTTSSSSSASAAAKVAPAAAAPAVAIETTAPAKKPAAKQDGWDDDFFKDF